MAGEIVDALLWRTRTAVRLEGTPQFAGHGVADPTYRPPRLPYASVLCPLDLQTESERSQPEHAFLSARTPGYLAGTTPVGTVPAPGQLNLRLDDEFDVGLDLDYQALQGAPWEEAGPDVAAVIEESLRDEVSDLSPPGSQRQRELLATTVRWDRRRRRLVVASGRRGPVPADALAAQPPSSMRLGAPTPHAAALGFSEAATTAPGRFVRHRLPSPQPMAFGARVDLWAPTQRTLAELTEAWARTTPTRGELLLRPALLARDLASGAGTIALRSSGEPMTRWSLAQLEPPDFVDLHSGVAPRRGLNVVASSAGLVLPGRETATLVLAEPPAIPEPWLAAHPAPNGWALTIGLRLGSNPPADAAIDVADLQAGAGSALRITVRVQNGGAVVTVAAGATDGGSFPSVAAAIDLQEVLDGIQLHALVDGTAGGIRVYRDSELVGASEGPPRRPRGTRPLTLVMGGGATRHELRITNLHLLTHPLGPADPRLRQSPNAAASWRVGDPVILVRSEDGFSASGPSFTAVVTDIRGDVLSLDRPVAGSWPRGSTLVGSRSVFFSQQAIRRRDDLTNALYRLTAEYRVSGFLDPYRTSVSARLAEETDLLIRELPYLRAEVDGAPPPPRVRPGAPGVESEIVPARAFRTATETETETENEP